MSNNWPTQFIEFNWVSMSTEDFLKNRERLEATIKKEPKTPVPTVVKNETSDVEIESGINNQPEEKNTEVEEKVKKPIKRNKK